MHRLESVKDDLLATNMKSVKDLIKKIARTG